MPMSSGRLRKTICVMYLRVYHLMSLPWRFLAWIFLRFRVKIIPFWDRMIVREAVSLNSMGKPLPPKVCHRGLLDAEISDGNHFALHGGSRLTAIPEEHLQILHFPLRRYCQLELSLAARKATPRVAGPEPFYSDNTKQR
jgi:hypothetical protein